MADTFTAILNLTKPEVGASTDTWGTKVNADLDTLDGLFQAGPALKLANGGTGATTAAGARTNLGLGGDATGTNLSALTNAATARSNLGLAIGTDVLPVADPSFTGTITGGSANLSGSLSAGLSRLDAGSIELGVDGSGDRSASIDFHASGTPGAIDHSARIIRQPGVNGNLVFENTGSGAYKFAQPGGAALATSGVMNNGLILQAGEGAAAINIGADGVNRINSAYSNNAGVGLPLAINVGGAEQLRVNPGGILVGTTSYGATTSGTSIAGNGSQITSVNAFNLTLNKPGGDPQTAYIPFFWNAGLVGYIAYNGNGGVQYNSGSDARLKSNIADAPSALSLVNDFRVRSYDWLASKNHDDYGFIAQELHQVYPSAVSAQADKEDGSMDMPWGVDYAKLVPVLTKAIQEQQAMIDQLKADVAALKAAA